MTTEWEIISNILNPWMTEGKTVLEIPNAPRDLEWEEVIQQSKQKTMEELIKDIPSNVTHCTNTTAINHTQYRNSVCFICVNTFQDAKNSLGVAGIYDAIEIAKIHLDMGFEKVYLIIDKPLQEFIDFVTMFLKYTKEYLTIYIGTHGGIKIDSEGEEKSGFHEHLLFPNNERISDVQLADILKTPLYYKDLKILLITDACHSGNIWNIPDDQEELSKFPKNFVTISSCNPFYLSYNVIFDSKLRSYFTYYFCKALREHPTYSFKQIQHWINQQIPEQKIEIHYSTQELVEKPFFPPKK